MEDAAILKMNLERFRRFLKEEPDSAKRRMIEDLIRNTETALQGGRPTCGARARDSSPTGGRLK
jgi:tartrate dehydratase alpha subunit/fumarate hydratase class I-like protein